MTSDIETLLRWLEIRKEQGQELSSLEELRENIYHSSLLKRLLEGKPPLPEPPPKSFGYPNYELVETGYCEPYSVFEIQKGKQTKIVIDQAPYNLVKKVSDSEWIVLWPTMPCVWWRVWFQENNWKMQKIPNPWEASGGESA